MMFISSTVKFTTKVFPQFVTSAQRKFCQVYFQSYGMNCSYMVGAGPHSTLNIAGAPKFSITYGQGRKEAFAATYINAA